MLRSQDTFRLKLESTNLPKGAGASSNMSDGILQSRLDAVSALVREHRNQVPNSQPPADFSEAPAPPESSSAAVSTDNHARDRSRSRDRSADPPPSRSRDRSADPPPVRSSECGSEPEEVESSEYENLADCGCCCAGMRNRHLGPTGSQARRCVCPLCGHRAVDGGRGCHRRVRIHPRTSPYVLCRTCGHTCLAILRIHGVDVESHRTLSRFQVRDT